MSRRGEGSRSGTGSGKTKRPTLEERVCKALAANHYVVASQIGVQVDAKTGEVTLVGTVPTDEQLRSAEVCARSVRGISAVNNRLKVESGRDGNKDE